MLTDIFLVLLIGSLPLLFVAGGGILLFKNRPTERDYLFRILFFVILLLPLGSGMIPRITTGLSVHEPSLEPIPIAAPAPASSAIPASVSIDETTYPVEAATQPAMPMVQPVRPIAAEPVPAIELPPVARESVLAETTEPDSAPPIAPRISFEFFSAKMLSRGGAVVWFLGAAFCFFLLFRSRSVYAGILNSATTLDHPAWLELCDELQRSLQIGRPVRYKISEAVAVPQVVGLRRPTVLLPRYFLNEKPNRAILIHELEHIRRNDIAWQLLASVACSVYWFQPLVWFFAARQRAAREEACDDQVLRLGEKGSDFAASLLDLSSSVHRGFRLPQRIGCTVTMPRQQSQIERRIVALLDPQRKRGPISMTSRLSILFGIVVAALFSVAICPAWETPKPVSETSSAISPTPAAGTSPEKSGVAPVAKTVVLPTPSSEPPGTDDDYVTEPKAIGVQQIPALSVVRSTVPFHCEVQTENGTTVAEANIVVKFTDGSQLDLQSDSKGRFLLWTCADGRWNRNASLIARKTIDGEPYVGVVKTNKDDREYKIILKKGKTITGTVKTLSGMPLKEYYLGTPEYGYERILLLPNFSLTFAPDNPPTMICGWADGEGLAYRFFRDEKNRTETEGDPLYVNLEDKIVLPLEGAAPLTIQAVDTEGNGLSGIEFSVYSVAYPPRMVGNELKTAEGIGLPLKIRTGENGIGQATYFPAWATGQLSVPPVQLHDGPNRYTRTKEFWPVADGKPILLVQEFVKTVPVRGTVRYPNGEPVAGLEIKTMGQGITLNDNWNYATTDAEGRYELLLPPYQWYVMAAKAKGDWAFPMQDGFAILPGPPVENFDIVMEPATKMTLKLQSDPDGKPLPGRKLFVEFKGRSDHGIERIGTEKAPPGFHMPIYRGMQPSRHPETTHGWYTTDENGCIALSLGSGHYAYNLEDARENDWFGTRGTFDVEFDSEKRVREHVILVPSREESAFTGRVLIQAADGKWIGAAGQTVSFSDPPMTYPGKSTKQNWRSEYPKTDADGRFAFERANRTMRIFVYDGKAGRAAYATVPYEQHDIELKMEPLLAVTGTIVNLETGEPIPNAVLEYRWRYEFDGSIGCGRNWMNIRQGERCFYAETTTDKSGRFTIEGLLPEQPYDLHWNRANDPKTQSDYWEIGGFRTEKPVDPKKPQDVGTIRVASLKPIGIQCAEGAICVTGNCVDAGSVADNLNRAREKCDPEYAWSRIGNYKSAILGLLDLKQPEAAKVAAKEMVELVDSTRKALREKGLSCEQGRFDEELYAVAIAFEGQGDKETGEEVRKHLEKFNDTQAIRRLINQRGVKDVGAILKQIDALPEKDQDVLIFDLFRNGLDEMSLSERLEHVRKLNRPDVKIQLLYRLADDFRREGSTEKSEELYNEALTLLKNLPTAKERGRLWTYAIRRIEKAGDMKLLHQAAVEMYDSLSHPFYREHETDFFPKVDLEKAMVPGSEERRKLTEAAGPYMFDLSARTRPLEVLVKTGEKEKALKLADRVAAYRNLLTPEQLAVCGYNGFLESDLAACANVYAECGEMEKAKELWQLVLKMTESGDVEQQSNVIWPVVSQMKSDLFKKDVRKLCLRSIKQMKTWEDENRPELTMFRRCDRTRSLAGILARDGFSDDARRVLDEQTASVRESFVPEKADGYLAQLAEGYARARFPEKAKELAESITNVERREKTLRVIAALPD